MNRDAHDAAGLVSGQHEPMPNEGGTVGKVVVGIDGSECSREALRFAAKEARLRGASLRIVCAWQAPVGIYGLASFTPAVDVRGFAGAARDPVEKEIGEVLDWQDGLVRRLVLREGDAARVLLDESRDADLLVLGSRGLGGFKGLMLGSVGQQCAAHAVCPVTIVHSPND